MSYFQVLGSRNGESEGNENEFGTDLSSSSLVFHPLRSPLNAIQDPLQNPREIQEIELDARGKSGVGRNVKKIETLSYGTPKVGGRGGKVHLEPSSAQSTPARSSLGKATNSGVVGACVGSRPPPRDSRGGGLSRGFRGMSIMPSEQFMEVPHFELVEDPSFWMDHNVQVLVRIRPMSTSEKALQGNVRCLRQDSSQSLTWLGHPETRFTFDHIACETISQEKLFKVAGLPMVENCMSGYNSCMFAYGQTGSGKTYTMMGEIHEMDGKLNEDCGMTPRIFEYLFTRIREEEERRSEENLKYSCKCSFLEIYNEHIIDLLEPSSTNLQIREDMKKGVYVENLTEYEVTTAKDVVQLLLEGATNRKMAATNMNSESSRSHSVFTCVIESRWDMDSMTHLRFGRLNLVDLAGSERQKSSGAEGERLKEAANINKSLSTLGLVINTLVVVAHGKHRHVPYRDSRLTFLLQDSLGGNSKTTIIANISPSTCSANETLSTLKFAQRAKLIQNNAKVNEDASGDVLALQRQIQQLKDQLTFFLKHQNFPNSLPFSLSNSEKSLPGELRETHNSLEGGVSVPYNRTNIPKRKMKCIKATLSGALRREKMSETRVRSLEAEIEHMNRLVHQQQEDAQRTKMILRFREEKIKKLEMLSDGLLSADEYLMEENNALSEEIQLLQEKIDRNPELTRFALENLRILEQLRMFQDFYEQGEKEVILAEVSDLRDQLVDALEGTYEHLKAPSTEQDKGTGKELEHCRRNLDACLEMNEKLTREVDQLRRELNSAFHTAADSSCIDAGLVETTDKSSSVEIVSIRNDLENKISSYNPLPTKNNMEMDNALALQSSVSDAKKELMDARTLIEEMEQQQLFLIEELNTLQKKNCVYEDLLKKKDSEELESQLKVRKDCNALGRHWKTEGRGPENAGLLVEGSGDNIMPGLQTKLDRLNRELEEARILNQQYQNENTSHVFHQTETEEVRQQVEVETAEAILHLQEELSSLQQELMDKLNPITEENAGLRNTIKARDDELRSLSEDWEKAMLELTNFLTDGCRSLEDASGHITSIASSFPERNVWISEHVEMAKKIFLEKERTIMQLQTSLEDAQEMGVELKLKLSSLKEATVAITEVRQLENDGNSREVIELQTALRDKMSAIKELESKLKCKDDQMIEALRQTDAASFDHDKYRNAGMMDEVDAQAVEIIQAQVEMAKQMFLETETVLIASYADAERYLASFKSEIVYTSSLLSKLVHEFTEDIRTMNKTFRDQNGQVKPRMLESLEAEEAEVGCNNNREMLHLKLANDSLMTDEKMEMNNSFIIKFEEARATLEEAEVMLNALLKANEEAKHMTDTWKQVGEELMIERVGLIEEVQQLKSSMFLKEGECESMQDQMLASLEDMADSVSSLQISFLQMKREVEESFKILYTDIVSLGQDLSNSISNSRSSLEDIWSDIVEKGFALFVMYQCYVGSSSKKISSFKSDFGSFQPLQKNFYSIVNDVEKRRLGAMEEKSLFKGINNIEDHSEDLPYRLSNSGYVAELQNSYEMIEKLEEEELGLTPDSMMSENLLLRTKLARKDELLKGLLFDISLLQESISNSKDFKDEAENMFMALTRTQHELAIKTTQLDDHILCHRKLEAKFVDSEGASFTSNSELAKTKETLDSLSKQNSELSVLLEDLQVKKSTLEGKLEEQKDVVRSLENEIIHMDFSIEERILASVENIEDELRRTIGERDRLLEEVVSLNDKLEMANALADENEAIAVEARQESESSKLYAEQKEEEAKILEHSVEELEHTINVLEKKVHEMGEEVKRHRLMRDDLELELESLKLRMLTVTENLDPEYSNSENDEVQMSRLLEIQEFKKQLRVLEKERTDQAREIKECREYISELLLHAEAQASQYQQKYKMLEDMIREVKTDPSAFPCPSSAVDKAEKISTRTRGSSSPFRCIAGLVQQMNLEQDQELSVAKIRIEELETLASSRQKEVCMLNTRLAAAENMTHDVIRDLLGLKLDMTNYANLIDQHEVQKLVEGAQQKTEEYIAKEQEILQLRKQINDLAEERQSCIEELNEKEAEMLASHLTLEQLKQRDQMLVAQNQMLKMDKANLKRKISEMDEMLKKHCEPHSLQQQILQPRKMKENVFKVNEELGKRLTQSEKLLSGVNDELSLYFKSDRRNPNETVEQGLRNKRQAAAQGVVPYCCYDVGQEPDDD